MKRRLLVIVGSLLTSVLMLLTTEASASENTACAYTYSGGYSFCVDNQGSACGADFWQWCEAQLPPSQRTQCRAVNANSCFIDTICSPEPYTYSTARTCYYENR